MITGGGHGFSMLMMILMMPHNGLTVQVFVGTIGVIGNRHADAFDALASIATATIIASIAFMVFPFFFFPVFLVCMTASGDRHARAWNRNRYGMSRAFLAVMEPKIHIF